MNKTRDRLTGATIAVLLQMGFVAIFIYSLPLMLPAKKLSREITFFLPRLREVARPAPGSLRGRPSTLPSSRTQPLTVPPIILPPVAPPPATDLQTFGNALFGCAPESRNNLTPEQRAHCSAFAAIPRDKDAMAEPRSLVKDLPRRQAELTARNTPARVPCISFRSQALAAGHQDTGGVVDPLCMLNGWINGFGGLPP
ncbi:MAG: hypothetical protein V4559_01085 [Pseudomonadota bacterium]